MKNLTELANKINSFDFFYEMSDCYRTMDRGPHKEREIISALSGLSNAELLEVKKGITKDMEFVNRYFSEFFKNLPELSEVLEASSEKEEPKKATFKTSYDRSEIFNNAWTMFKGKTYNSFSECLHYAQLRAKAIRTLRAGVGYITYEKADKSLREAIGTLRNGNFTYEPRNSTKKKNLTVVKYYDLEAKGFRSFRVDRLIDFTAA